MQKPWIAASVIGLGLFSAVGLGGAYYLTIHSTPTPKMTTGDLAGVMIQSDEQEDASAFYEPQSEYIEEGLDPEVTRFDLGGEAGAADGTVDVDRLVSQHVRQNQNSLMPCYAEALQEQDLQGRVDMEFGIAPDGRVALVRVTDSTLRSPTTEDCLVDVARTWSFDKTGRETLTRFKTDFGFYYE